MNQEELLQIRLIQTGEEREGRCEMGKIRKRWASQILLSGYISFLLITIMSVYYNTLLISILVSAIADIGATTRPLGTTIQREVGHCHGAIFTIIIQSLDTFTIDPPLQSHFVGNDTREEKKNFVCQIGYPLAALFVVEQLLFLEILFCLFLSSKVWRIFFYFSLFSDILCRTRESTLFLIRRDVLKLKKEIACLCYQNTISQSRNCHHMSPLFITWAYIL